MFKSMKTLRKIKLNQLCEAELEKKSMNEIWGGSPESCTCGCHYANSNGSSTATNGGTNWSTGKDSYGGGEVYGVCGNCMEIFQNGQWGSTSASNRSDKWGF